MQKHYYRTSTSHSAHSVYPVHPALTETLYIYTSIDVERSLSYLKAFTIAGKGTYIIITKAFYLLKALSRYFGFSMCFITILWEHDDAIPEPNLLYSSIYLYVWPYMELRTKPTQPLFESVLLFAQCTLARCPYGFYIKEMRWVVWKNKSQSQWVPTWSCLKYR